MKTLFYTYIIKYHIKMREFYEVNPQFQNPMKVIYHDMRVQRYEFKLERLNVE